jgi:alkanesulfonate monooxygenase SsuD/methylene tetrahydromethanopterin reductase-like flavin-dependent oxidoreductase (luciferase family)
MRMGFILPGGTASEQLSQAILAEQTGWDGIFVWEGAYGVDAWSLLAAMAARTNHIKLGSLLTALPWRRPWKVASQVATVDQLSNGRAILTVGVGAMTDDLPETGEETDLKTRAGMLDDGIDVMRDLWEGRTSHRGPHYHYTFEVDDQIQVTRPVQARVPIWVVAVWPRPKSMRRVLRCDGIVPQHAGIADIPDIRSWLQDRGAPSTLDITAEGQTDGSEQTAEDVRAWADAGCTWWLESNWEMPHHSGTRMDEVRRRLELGPPQIGS